MIWTKPFGELVDEARASGMGHGVQEIELKSTDAQESRELLPTMLCPRQRTGWQRGVQQIIGVRPVANLRIVFPVIRSDQLVADVAP